MYSNRQALVKADQQFAYSEQIDVVPTLCYLMGAPLPDDNVIGRVLAEALTTPPANATERQGQPMKELSLTLMEGDTALTKLRAAAMTDPSLRPVLADFERDFYDIENMLHWCQFGAVQKSTAKFCSGFLSRLRLPSCAAPKWSSSAYLEPPWS